jgi:hypothetical protein
MSHAGVWYHVHQGQLSPGAPDLHCESDSSSKLDWEGGLKENTKKSQLKISTGQKQGEQSIQG